MSGPTGQPYYHNAQTQQSTYVRPLPTFANLPPPQAVKAKKEKPLVKTPVPGTDWIRVLTTEGNTFYTNKAKKESVWSVPDEIKEAVAALEAEEDAKKIEQGDVAEETLREVERIKSEVQEAVGKRKAADPVPVDEVVISKKARVDDEKDEDEGEQEQEDEEDESDDSEMEDWQREAAEQLAKEAEEEKQRQEEERKREEEEKARQLKEAETQKGRPLNMPNRVDLSIDEAKALFKVCGSPSI